MRHALRSRRLGRSRSERAALVRSLTQAVLRYERIQTTLPKAKEAQRAVERLITTSKAGTLTARRRVEAWLQEPQLAGALFAEITPRFKSRAGGYTRIIHAGYRTGDGAPMAILELVERKPETTTKPKGKVKETVAKPPLVSPPSKKPGKPAARTPEQPKAGAPKAPPEPKKDGGFLKGLRKFFTRGRRQDD